MAKFSAVFRSFTKGLLLTAGILAVTSLSLAVGGAFFVFSKRGNEWVREHLESYLGKKFRTRITIGEFNARNLHRIRFFDFKVLDPNGKELIVLKSLSIETSWKYFLGQSRSLLKSIRLEQFNGTIHRKANVENFNFQFLLDAFPRTDGPNPQQKEMTWLLPEHITLTRFLLIYDDKKEQHKARLAFSLLETDLNISGKMQTGQWVANHLVLDSAKLDISLGCKKQEGKDANQAGRDLMPAKIALADLRILRSSFQLNDASEGLFIDSEADQFILKNGLYIPAENKIDINKIVSERHYISIQYGSDQQRNHRTSETKNTNFTIAVDTLLANANGFSINVTNKKRFPVNQFDPFHNDFKDIYISATDLIYNQKEIGGQLNHLSLTDSRHFKMGSLAAKVRMWNTGAIIDDLRLRSSKNSINSAVKLSYPSLRHLISEPGMAVFNARVVNTTVHLQELAYFLPVLLQYPQIRPLLAQSIHVNTQAAGTPRNIRLNRYEISTPNNLLLGSGEIHTPVFSDTWLKLDIQSHRLTKRGITEIVSEDILQPNLLKRFPDKMQLTGKLTITSRILTPDIRLQSDFGNFRLKGTFKDPGSFSKIAYDFTYHTNQFLLGKIFQDTLLGPLTSRGYVKGTGLANVNKIKLKSHGYIDLVTIGGNPLKDILFETALSEGKLSSDLSSSDPDLNFDLSPTIYFNNPGKLGEVYGTVHKADLMKLGILSDSLIIGASIIADFTKISPDTLIGAIAMSGIKSAINGTAYEMDSLYALADYFNGQQRLQLKSTIADIDAEGHFAIAEIPVFLKNISKSIGMGLPFPDSMNVTSIKAHGSFHIPRTMQPLIPSLKSVAPFQFSSNYDKSSGVFNFRTDIDSLSVANIAFDSLHVTIQSNRLSNGDVKTDYHLAAKKIASSSLLFPNMALDGAGQNGIHEGNLVSSAYSLQNFSRIPFTFHGLDKNPFISIRDSLYLNGSLWEINKNNAIYITSKTLAGSQIQLKNGQKALGFETDRNAPDGLPYQLKLSNFDLKSALSLVNADTSLIAGIVNGSATVQQLSPLGLTSQLDIDQLKVKGVSVGKLKTEIQSQSEDSYVIKANLEADPGSLHAEGKYNISEKIGEIGIQVRTFPITLFNGFFNGQIDSLRGNLNGDLSLNLDSLKTRISGLLSLDSSSFFVHQMGSYVRAVKGNLLFADNQMILQPVELTDGNNGKSTVSGSVDIPNLKDISYQFKLDASNFEAIGSQRNRGQLIYGKGKTNASLELNGDLNQLRLTGKVALSDSAHIFYKNSQAINPDYGDGLLEFVKPKENRRQENPLANRPSSQGISSIVNTNVSIPSSAKLTLILDEYTGEKIVVSGKSNLNYSRHAGGEMQLNGKYEVSSGTYTFKVGNNIKKEFALENGGTIQWTGDVTEPVCDLTATYKVTTSAGVLLQGSSSDPEAGKRKFDFLVKLKVKGNLSKPDISFELGMYEKDQDTFDGIIYSKIKQINSSPSDVTKQVMSLLVLNSFMGDSPFGSLSQLSNASLEVGAYNTIGNLLTSELNSMLAGVVKAVDITFGVNWSESTDAGRSSTRSDIKLGLGKSLFNHRLNLYVGNNFGVETLSGSNSGFSGLANDISVEYLLNAEGKYRIKGYHVRDNELTLHGEHMETGVKFIIVWDFDGQKTLSDKRGKKDAAL